MYFSQRLLGHYKVLTLTTGEFDLFCCAGGEPSQSTIIFIPHN